MQLRKTLAVTSVIFLVPNPPPSCSIFAVGRAGPGGEGGIRSFPLAPPEAARSLATSFAYD